MTTDVVYIKLIMTLRLAASAPCFMLVREYACLSNYLSSPHSVLQQTATSLAEEEEEEEEEEER
jgi:hypothetical protein